MTGLVSKGQDQNDPNYILMEREKLCFAFEEPSYRREENQLRVLVFEIDCLYIYGADGC